MFNFSNHSPKWFWFAFLPFFGGLAIAYVGNKFKNNNLIGLGVTSVIMSFILGYSEVVLLIWLAQIGTAFYLKKQWDVRSGNNQNSLKARRTRKLSGNPQEKIDINTCSKDDLVYCLDLPIVYANDIDAIRSQGYLFTHVEELHEIAGLPENYIRKLSPLVTFSYDINKEADVSWRRLNSYSLEELIQEGLDTKVAQKIVEERQINGGYKSVIDVQIRTGLPLNSYRHLI